MMTKIRIFAALAGVLALASLPAVAQTDPHVGGAAMSHSKNIVENASASKDLTTLVAAVKAAGLVETLESAGPFTVFAPTNEAFDKLPAGTVANLLKPENKQALAKLLKYHVVAGKMSSSEILEKIRQSGGKAMLTTVEGAPITATKSGGKIILTDEKGGKATISIANVYQSNGVVHVIDAVLMPN
jgi:uncharacterized surface protein with fasciclin (FAS1) repeats